MNLAFLTANHWRPLRRRMASEGISDPMGQFPHMHALLDATESIIMESFYDAKNPQKAQSEKEAFQNALYRPDPSAIKVNGEGYKPIPAGFEDGGDDAWDWSGGAGAE